MAIEQMWWLGGRRKLDLHPHFRFHATAPDLMAFFCTRENLFILVRKVIDSIIGEEYRTCAHLDNKEAKRGYYCPIPKELEVRHKIYVT